MSVTPAVGDVVATVLVASRALVAVAARSLADLDEAITLPQFRMLVVLMEHPGSSLTRLADELGVSPSTAMRMVDRLEASGAVRRAPDPDDRRASRLSLTEHGRRVVDDVTRRRTQEIARIVEAMPPEQRTALVDALRAFGDAAGDLAQDPAAAESGARDLGW